MFRDGEQIGPYVLLRKLGRGGFGEVWLAEKRSQFLSKKVAVKLLHGDQVNFETIQREAVLWEEASGHPNVLPIIDADAYDDQVVIVSEYADGGSLSDKLLAEGKPPVRDAVELTIGILNGLEYLHGKRIIHRDIKPQNVLLQGKTPRLADFGISRAMQTTAISSTIIGTDAYMSPEAFDGKRTVQTDIWSTGVVLYQLLIGSLPFPQEHPSERMFAVLTKEFAPLPDDIPSDLRQIVEKALTKLPENRYQSAAEMSEALIQAKVWLDHPTLAKTEVFDRAALPVFSGETISNDPEATVVRVNIPDPDETVVRQTPFVAQSTPRAPADLSDRPALSPVSGKAPNGAGDPDRTEWRSWFDNMTTGKVVGVGFAIVVGLFVLGQILSALTRGGEVSNRSTPIPSNSNRTASNTLASNRPANANMSGNTTNSYSSNANITSNNTAANTNRMINSAANTYQMPNSTWDPRTTPTAQQLAAFCQEYRDGWAAAWKREKGKNFTPPYAPCPPAPAGGDKYIFDKGLDDGNAAARKTPRP